MKISSLLRSWQIVLCLFAAAPVLAAANVGEPAGLKVQVNIPPSWSPFVDQHLSEMFTDAIRELLRRRGFAEPVADARLVGGAADAQPQLTLNLVEWRIRRTGAISCVLSASLETPSGTRELGIFEDSSFHWLGSGTFTLAREFDEAASGALNALCDAMARSELLPGLRVRGS